MSGTVVILLGAPGAGKGTQAVRLAEELALPHVSTGDLFRENLSRGTELGQKAKGYMSRGKLVPDELVIDMLFDRVGQSDCARGYLLDGFPRTTGQADTLGVRLSDEFGVIVIEIAVDDSTIVERITGRLSCKDGHVHHRTFSPPRAEGVCDMCGSELYQREDDTEVVVTKRLAEYDAQTAPLVAYYEEQGVLCTVDGRQAPDEVFEACKGCLGAEA
ncbi:MAG: adenylate kinase [bacterium]|nr:adenylate kinase [bacterium]